MSIDAILGVAGSEREDFCYWLRAHTSALYTLLIHRERECSYNPSKEFTPSFVTSLVMSFRGRYHDLDIELG